MAESPEELLGMQHEFDALKSLSHRHVMGLHQSIEGTNCSFAIMEYLGGGSLKLVLSQRLEPLPELAAAAIVSQLASALSHCHDRGWIHRDVKAANVLFADSSRSTVKLVDFGFAMPWSEGSKKQTLPKVGTPSHMAPEVHTKRAYDGQRADIFALGVLLYEMLHLLLPFDAPSLEGLKMRVLKGNRRPTAVKLSAGAKSLITAMLQTNPEKRPDAVRACTHPWLPQPQPLAGVGPPSPT